MGSLSFQITTGSTISSKTICFEKIIGPIADFEVLPFTTGEGETIYACTDQLIYFTNQSQANGGTAIVSYFWDFGDNTTSTAEHPTHTYQSDGTFMVKLTVTNACNCKHTIGILVEVGPKGFDIQCPSIVCEDQRATYTLPFDARAICGDAFNWSVIGGTIADINQSTGDLTVIWDDVDATGFGYVTFDPRDCHLECYFPTTLRVPVIQSKGTIVGPDSLCVYSYGRYELPQWPTTDFQWEIVGNENNDLADVILTDQRNEVVIFPFVEGTLLLKATYVNTLTGCTGIALFTIISEPRVEFLGDTEFCQGTVATYTTASGDAANWTLFAANGTTVITTLNGSNQFQYTFTTAGNYILSTAGSALCEGEQKTITIVANPQAVALNSISGTTVVCPSQPYTYTIQNPDSNSTYHWTIQNGSFIGAATGSSVNVSFSATGPHSLTVVRQSINPLVCASSPTTLPINLQQVLVDVISEDNVNSICANSYQDFFAYQSGTTNLYTQGELYTWSLSDSSLGSVTEGQGTNAATFLWYNVSAPTQVDVILTIQKCTLPPQVFTYQVTIIPIPIIQISADSSVCSGAGVTFTVSSTNGVSLAPGTVVTWTNGGVTTTGSTTQNFTFSNNTGSNIGRTITAFIATPNGCDVSTNVAVFNVSVFPEPPASLSIVSGGNVFCDVQDIATVLEIGTSIAGLTVTWYRNGAILSPQPVPNTTLAVTPAMGFGSYRFSVVDSKGCIAFSNIVNVYQNCNDTVICELDPVPVLTNTSFNDCGIIYLSGSTTVPSSFESFKIVGPNFNHNNYTGTQITAEAGEYHVYYQARYTCQNAPFNLITLRDYNKITVPYVPKFAYQAVCNGNTDFTVTFFDETNFFAPVTDRDIKYYIRPNGTPPSSNVLVSGNVINSLGSGTYIVTQVVKGKLNGVWQDECSYELVFTLSTMSNAMFIELVEEIHCHDTAVRFEVSFSQSSTDSYLWTFDEGAQSTLFNPKRVFSTSGPHTVYVTVTNALGCSRTLSLPITIPEKCFYGDVVTTPNPPSVCAGYGVTLTYQANPSQLDTCAVEEYIWMNGLTEVTPPVNGPNLVVTTPGSYWLKVRSADLCEYATPSRISPIFKPLPSLTLTAATSICLGGIYPVKATTNATTISWTLNTVAQPQFNNNTAPIFSNLSAGTHTITATVLLDGCSNSSSVTVQVLPAPTDLVILTPQMVSCSPYEYKLTAQTAATGAHFTWSDGQIGNPIYVSAGGPYRVTATVGDCSFSTQIDVPKDPEVYSWIFPSGCYDACKENIGTLIGPRVYLPYWAWEKDQVVAVSNTTSFPTPYELTGTGEYAFTLNTGDCELTTDPLYFKELACKKCKIERVIPQSIIKNEDKFCSFTVVLDIASGDDLNAVISSLSGTMVINPSAFDISAGLHPYMFTFIPTGTFTGGMVEFIIEALDKDGNPCTYTFLLDIPSCEEESQVNKEQVQEPTKHGEGMDLVAVTLYPNPTNDAVTISFTGIKSKGELFIYDLTGRLMQQTHLKPEDKAITVHTGSYPAGVYIVVLREAGVLVSQHKLMKN